MILATLVRFTDASRTEAELSIGALKLPEAGRMIPALSPGHYELVAQVGCDCCGKSQEARSAFHHAAQGPMTLSAPPLPPQWAYSGGWVLCAVDDPVHRAWKVRP